MLEHLLFPNERVIVTRHFDVMQDWEVPIPGFFIVASKRQIRSIEEFNDEEAAEFGRLVRDVRKGMSELLNIRHVYLFQRDDVPNFHLWMLPRYDWMNQFGTKVQSVRPIINFAKQYMVKEHILEEVRQVAAEMRKYMEGKNYC